MYRHFYILLGAILALSACQNKPANENEAYTQADIVVRATSELSAPAPIIQATFVPNSVASWLGHIIMIDADGNLHRATTDSQVNLIDKGDYRSVIGLARIKQPGVFLAITKTGSLKAYIEADDDGNFKALPVSINEKTRLTQFCQSALPHQDVISAMNSDGIVTSYKIDVTENASVAIAATDGNVKTKACSPLTYDGEDRLSLSDNAPHLSAIVSTEPKTVSISNGLSIAGISNPAYVGATTVNMGSVFRNGVILATENDSGRIVLIARDYFVEALKSQE